MDSEGGMGDGDMGMQRKKFMNVRMRHRRKS